MSKIQFFANSNFFRTLNPSIAIIDIAVDCGMGIFGKSFFRWQKKMTRCYKIKYFVTFFATPSTLNVFYSFCHTSVKLSLCFKLATFSFHNLQFLSHFLRHAQTNSHFYHISFLAGFTFIAFGSLFSDLQFNPIYCILYNAAYINIATNGLWDYMIGSGSINRFLLLQTSSFRESVPLQGNIIKLYESGITFPHFPRYWNTTSLRKLRVIFNWNCRTKCNW